ncbi:hypothetical protein JGU66_09185 [Myxococcaceae bacterium JPH2]|nr:hypothetical protein [Myxococcaceae bacterium JPH2]
MEKSEVCSGEDNLISVKAHSPDGNDAYLHSTIGNGSGARVPLRVWLNPDGTFEPQHVTVFGKNNVATSVEVPHYTVKDCQPQRIVEVFSRQLPNSEEDYEFLARLIELPGSETQGARKPFVPARFVWTFDDAETVTTTVPVVSHPLTSVPGRPWAMYEQHLVRVEVSDGAGRKLMGRSSLQLLNPAFENFDKKGIVTVFATGTPRFPVQGDDGVVRQTFRLFHRWKGSVRVDKVTALRALAAPGDAPPLPEQSDEVSLGVSSIPEGRGVEVPVKLDTKADPQVVSVTYVLEGTSADGRPARGTFSVMRPPPRPTKDNSTPVTDPLLLAKIKRARELLHQEFVTDEDLWRLEREGRFADLQVKR